MRLDLIRHPQPEIAPGICYGCSDISVDLSVMRAVLSGVTSQLPAQAVVHSSPLQRCLSLAYALSDQLITAPVCIDERLQEMDFGAWEGRSWEQIGRAEVSAWEQDVVHYCPGGGESVLQMIRRVVACYEEIRAARRDTIIVCHAGTIRLMRAWHAVRDTSQLEAIAQQVMQTPHQIAYGEHITLEL